MKIDVKKLGAILFVIFHTLNGYSDHQTLEFRKVSPKGGLTFGSIHQITEDAHGFLWFGSHHGLFRYDTETIQKFVHIPNNSKSIPSNYITSITKDPKGSLWFASNNGICYYNEPRENFERCTFYNSNKESLPNNILQIISNDSNSLWILSDRKLAVANTATRTFKWVDVYPDDHLVSYIYLDDNKRLWVKSTKGMVYWSDAPYAIFNQFGEILDQPVQTMLFSKNRLWIGYESYGAECYDIYGTLIGSYGTGRSKEFDIKSNRVRKITEDQEGRIWFGTYNGIAILDQGQITFHTKKNTRGLMHTSIYDIFTDSKKGIWISTWSGTISYANPYDNTFEHIHTDLGLSNNVVSSIAEINGLVWIGTEGGGLNSYNPHTNQFIKHTLNPNLNDDQNIKTLEIDNNNALWVGTFNDGLWVIRSFDKNGHPHKPEKVLQGGFYHLKKEGDFIWAASYFMGLYKIDTETYEYENFRGDADSPNTVHTNHLRTLLIDSNGGLWVGTQIGLNYRKNPDGEFVRFLPNPMDSLSLGGSQIYSIFEDSQKRIWIGTSYGLSRFNAQSNTFTNFTPNEGIPGYEIYGITEDRKNHLWISTDKGIAEFDPQKMTYRNFTEADGLQGNQFNPGSVYHSALGKAYFGGPNGLTIFNPDHIKVNTIAPKAKVVEILINNQLQIPSNTQSIVSESILTVDQFHLEHDQNSITFHFVANNYLSPQKNKFSYRLLNYDDNWIDAGSHKSATYTKIPPGHYIFQVKAANNDGIWNLEPAEIAFTIGSPWWQRWYSYLVYLLMAVSLTYYIQRERLIKQRLLHDVYLEKINSQSEKELNNSKLTFFTNISHEIKTPLSLILSPLDFILNKRNDDQELVDVLKTIKRNANRLKHLLHQVIDIRRIDADKLDFAPGMYNLIDIIHEINSCFSLEATEREIDFQFETEFDAFTTSIDPDKFDKIIFNLLTNAFKFVPDQGEVNVLMVKSHEEKPFLIGCPIDGDYIEIRIFNSNSYIPEDEFKAVFERFYQGKGNKKRGTGIGLHMVKEYVLLHNGQIDLSSDQNKGTCFTIRFPLNLHNLSSIKTENPKIAPEKLTNTKNASNTSQQLQDGNRALILIIEDNTELRIFLRKSLSNNYAVATASNGKRGYEQALELNPDLIISDVMMPEMNGLELCLRIKEDVNTSHIPVILLTALSAEEHQIEGYRKGADAYIAKPFSEKLLCSQIENLLLNRQKLKERLLDPESTLTDGELRNNDLKLITRAISIVEEHFLDTNFTVEILAEKLHMSRTSLHRKLRAHTDQSATEFIRFVRLKKALKMLKSGNYSIDEVSYIVGFNTPSYFSQSFKKQFGKSPKEYLGQK